MAAYLMKTQVMLQTEKKLTTLSQLKNSQSPVSLPTLSTLMLHSIPERTLRRWLVEWVEAGILTRTGKKRGTRYQYINTPNVNQLGIAEPSGDYQSKPTVTFLKNIPKYKREAVLEQIRDLWTHNSTALEGNTLTLGDTHAVLGLGLTVSGKPLREHQEIVGHAKAIDILYQSVAKPLTKELIFDLHKAVQTEVVNDIFKPYGGWKVEINGSYAVSYSDSQEGTQVFIEYAHPLHVNGLMESLIKTINTIDISTVTFENAARLYAKVHMAIVHIHPFWDGNGHIARLLSNSLLLKAGLPPLVIEKSQRREYIECLADYQIKIGKLTDTSELWPDENALKAFNDFCETSYQATKNLIEQASE